MGPRLDLSAAIVALLKKRADDGETRMSALPIGLRRRLRVGRCHRDVVLRRQGRRWKQLGQQKPLQVTGFKVTREDAFQVYNLFDLVASPLRNDGLASSDFKTCVHRDRPLSVGRTRYGCSW